MGIVFILSRLSHTASLISKGRHRIKINKNCSINRRIKISLSYEKPKSTAGNITVTAVHVIVIRKIFKYATPLKPALPLPNEKKGAIYNKAIIVNGSKHIIVK